MWPFSTLQDWLSDESESLLAEVGYSAGPNVYNTLAPRMVAPPSTDAEAYEQAIYFLGIAARRADYEDEKEAQNYLVEAKREIENKKSQLETDWICTATGFGCLSNQATRTLRQAVTSIRSSGLNEEDQKKLIRYLNSNYWAVQSKRFAPAIIGLGVVGVGFWYWRSTRKG